MLFCSCVSFFFFAKWFYDVWDCFKIVSGLFHFVSCGSGCSCCFELFPIVLVLVLLVADWLLLVPNCFSDVLCRSDVVLVFWTFNSVVLRCFKVVFGGL